MDGFTNGFNLGYEGPQNIKCFARNHTLKVGNKVDLWNKVMKEVREKRYIGPLRKLPFQDGFIQSPLGNNNMLISFIA